MRADPDRSVPGHNDVKGDKKVYVFAARGGIYAGTPLDSQTNYVRDFLGFLGMDNTEFVYAEGLNRGETAKEAALAGAKLRLTALTA